MVLVTAPDRETLAALGQVECHNCDMTLARCAPRSTRCCDACSHRLIDALSWLREFGHPESAPAAPGPESDAPLPDYDQGYEDGYKAGCRNVAGAPGPEGEAVERVRRYCVCDSGVPGGDETTGPCRRHPDGVGYPDPEGDAGALERVADLVDAMPEGFEWKPLAHIGPLPMSDLRSLLAAVDRLTAADERLRLARQALVSTGYFTEDEVGPDIAPRIIEVWAAKMEPSHRHRLVALADDLMQQRDEARDLAFRAAFAPEGPGDD